MKYSPSQCRFDGGGMKQGGRWGQTGSHKSRGRGEGGGAGLRSGFMSTFDAHLILYSMISHPCQMGRQVDQIGTKNSQFILSLPISRYTKLY